MFTYDFAHSPAISYVRLLISDTKQAKPIFSDEEITAFYTIQSSTYQSSTFYSWPGGQSLPTTPASVLRVAALALDSLASNRARLASVARMLDVTLSVSGAAKALHDQAEALRQIEDDSGAFALIEQTPTAFAFQDRFFKQMQRQSVGGL